MMVLRLFPGGERVPVVAVMRERAVVRHIGEDSGSGEFFVHPSTQNPPLRSPLRAAPRADPSVRDYRTGLLPWVCGGEAVLRVWVLVAGSR